MTGGAGNDMFVFANGDFGGTTTATADEIVDFTSGQDTIDLSQVDANSLLGGDQAFAFVGTARSPTPPASCASNRSAATPTSPAT